MIRRAPGFTLVEVLIAISVSAVVAALAYQSLASASDAARRTQSVAEQVDAIDRVWQLLARDLRQTLPPPEQPSAAEAGAAGLDGVDHGLRGEGSDTDTAYGEQGFVLRLRRAGWQNPLGQNRSELQGVGYQLREGKLYRFFWPIRNSSEWETEQIRQAAEWQTPLLEGVESLKLRFLPPTARTFNDNAWRRTWPPGENQGAAPGLPVAVEMVMTVADFGEIQRVFYLPAGF